MRVLGEFLSKYVQNQNCALYVNDKTKKKKTIKQKINRKSCKKTRGINIIHTCNKYKNLEVKRNI